MKICFVEKEIVCVQKSYMFVYDFNENEYFCKQIKSRIYEKISRLKKFNKIHNGLKNILQEEINLDETELSPSPERLSRIKSPFMPVDVSTLAKSNHVKSNVTDKITIASIACI